MNHKNTPPPAQWRASTSIGSQAMPSDALSRMKRFLLHYLPLALLVGALTAYLVVQQGQHRQAAFEAGESAHLKDSAQLFLHDLNRSLKHLQGLAQEPPVRRALAAPLAVARPQMEEALQTLLYRNPDYAQARWIGADGMELARVDRAGDRVALTPSGQLQDKATVPT